MPEFVNGIKAEVRPRFDCISASVLTVSMKTRIRWRWQSLKSDDDPGTLLRGRLSLRQLEYFVHVAECGSFSRAAHELSLVQSALSRQVSLLEVGLQAKLLRRHSRGIELTEAGKRLVDHGLAILERVAQAEEDIGADQEEPVGQIVVGLPPTLGRLLTVPLIEGFRRRTPKARLTIVEGFSTHIVEWITTGRVDVGVVYSPEAQPSIEIVPVLDETLHLIQPATAEAPCTPLRLRELSGFPLIVPECAQAMRRLLETSAALAGVELDIAWEVSSVPAIIDMVCAGHGHAVLTASATAASGRSAELAVRPIVEPTVTSVVCMVTSTSRPATSLVRHTRELLAELVRALARAAGAPGASERARLQQCLPARTDWKAAPSLLASSCETTRLAARQ